MGLYLPSGVLNFGNQTNIFSHIEITLRWKCIQYCAVKMGAWTLKEDTWWMERGVKEWIKHHFIIKVNRMVPVWGIFGRKSYFFMRLNTTHQQWTRRSFITCTLLLFSSLPRGRTAFVYIYIYIKVFILERRGKDLFWKGCYCTFEKRSW